MTSVNGDARDLRDARNVDQDVRDDSDLLPDSAPISSESEIDDEEPGLDPRLPDTLRMTLEAQGFKSLTPVQRAVLDADLRDHDLRISSQTGSGKTVAIGIALYELLTTARAKSGDTGRTVRAIAIVPTRELAAQVARELSWLYRKDDMRVISVTGGTSVGGELRSLREGADIVIGTPGRLLDHLQRGAIDARQVGAVVLDEADQMLDFGFREELEGILEALPKDRRTHLCSATFSREVVGLANKFQKDAVSVEGTRLGVANVDIAHVAILVQPSQRADVLVNELLRDPDLTTLVFARTRADAAELATTLSAAGFQAAPLTGELEQRDRTRTLAAFRSGAIAVLVATDVAARGLDIPDVGRVIHADPPGDSEAYTHRSGRTARAGRKGTSLIFVPPRAREGIERMLRRARVEVRWAMAPTAAVVRAAEDARLLESLRGEGEVDERSKALADALLEEHEARALVAKLIARGGVLGRSQPRSIDAFDPNARPSMMRGDRRPPSREAW
ncbi:MAG: DEAD/DEAH box helicase, partial [Polyangiales bacterium]